MTGRSHRMRVVGGVPASVLRVALVVIGSALTFALNPYPIWQGVGVVALLAGAALPRTLASWGAVVSIVIGVLLAEPSLGRTALAVLAVHLVHVMAALTLVVPATGRLAPAALLPSLRRLVLVQAIAQPLAYGLGLLAGLAAAGLDWLAPAGALILAALTIAVHRLRAREDASESR